MEKENSEQIINYDESVPHHVIAREGLKLLINNKEKKATELFLNHKENLCVYAGYSFVVLMEALMTFEEDKLIQATITLKDIEKSCLAGSSWFRPVKSKISNSQQEKLYWEYVERQIILADVHLCLAILVFLQNDISGYFRGGWILRKSWKIYQNIYTEIEALYKEIENSAIIQTSSTKPITGYCNNSFLPTSHSIYLDNSSYKNLNESKQNIFKKSISAHSALCSSSKQSSNYWTPFSYFLSHNDKNVSSYQYNIDTIKRLMSAVSFGYGLFQLGVSLLPSAIVKLTSFLGFGGDRSNGINCLMFSRTGTDMRSPLATLSLLWYHTIARPFYGLDGSNIMAGVQIGEQLIDENEQDFSSSSYFLFFKGRIHRLKGNIKKAIQYYEDATESSNQRAMKIISIYEAGWCHLILLDFEQAQKDFSFLKESSRWSRAYYCYISGICGGCIEIFHDFADCKLKNMQSLTNVSNDKPLNNLDILLLRRFRLCAENNFNHKPIFFKLLVYELLYLWNTLPNCGENEIETILKDCESEKNHEDEPMKGLSKLIMGCCYCYIGQYSLAIENFQNCLEQRQNISSLNEDAHISAFAQFELAHLLTKDPHTKEESKRLLLGLNQYKGYDFEHRLVIRAHTLLKNL